MHTVAVVGAGVVGLTSALMIQKHLKSQVTVTIYTEKISPNTTGDVSAGLWTPYLLQDTPQDDVIEWSKATLYYLRDLWINGEAKEYGITLQPMLNVTTEKPYKMPEWSKIAIGRQLLTQEKINELNKEYKKEYTGGFMYMAFTWEPAIFLPQLLKDFVENGGNIMLQKITDLQQLSDYDVIVNCTGLGSRQLVSDISVQPVRGQVTRVYAPMLYQTFLDDSDDGCYIIANTNTVVLGGTHQENDYNLKVDPEDKKMILDSCYERIPALKNQPIIRHAVGLRPGRNKVRLESEIVTTPSKLLKIVHNYGHGGSGVTLSIGCAEDTAKLVQTFLCTSKL